MTRTLIACVLRALFEQPRVSSKTQQERIAESSALVYPLQTEPQTGDGSAVEVAPGLFWLRDLAGAWLPVRAIRFRFFA